VETKAPSPTRSLTVLFLVNVLNFYDRQVLGPMAEPLRREFHLSDTQLGALTTVFTIVCAIASFPLGRLADTGNRKRLLALGVAVWAALTGLGGLAASYGMLLATRIGVGIGEAACAPAATSWIGDLVPPERRTRAMAWFMMAVPVGGLLSFSIGGPVAQAFGWRRTLALAALPAVALIPALLWLREPARVRTEAARNAAPGALLKIPAFWWIAASGAIVNFALYSFFTFLSAFLTRVHGLTVAQAGLWYGFGSGVAGITGAIAAGVFGDRVGGNRGRARMRIAAAAALAAAPAAFFAISLPVGHATAAVLLLMLGYGLLQTYYGLVYAAMQDVVPADLRGTAMATYFLVMYLGGASFGPLITGSLSDHFARAAAQTAGSAVVTEAAKAAGLHQAMYVIPCLALALACVLWAGAQSIGSNDGTAGVQ
jgi:predicted MFS family arabinose efflux permease